jgi:hypothetical protein
MTVRAGRISRYTCPDKKMQLLEFDYFWKFDTKFDFKIIELAKQNSIFNQQGQKQGQVFVYIPPSISQRDECTG